MLYKNIRRCLALALLAASDTNSEVSARVREAQFCRCVETSQELISVDLEINQIRKITNYHYEIKYGLLCNFYHI